MKYSSKREELFEQIYAQYQHDVYKIALYYVKDEHVAQDLMQRAFIAFYGKLYHIKPDKIINYLGRCVKYMAMNWLRDFKRLSDGQIEDLNDEDLKIDSVEDVCMREYEHFSAWELADEIMTDLYFKNRNWYEAVAYSYYFDIPQVTLAKSLNIAPEVLYNRLTRAKKWIRAKYGEKYEEYLKKKHG